MSSSLAEQFVRVCTSYPEKPAVIERAGDQRKETSYLQLYNMALGYASYLISNNLRPGDRVAVLCPNCPEYIAVYYGALLAGATTVPLNTAARMKDLKVWLEHSGSKFLFLANNHPDYKLIATTFDHINQIVLRLNVSREVISGNEWAEISVQEDEFEMEGVEQHSKAMASIIYTSGTTGQPKGVVLTNENLITNMQQILSYLPLQNTDKTLCVLPFYFSFGNSLLHTHLMVGATIFLENSFMFPVKLLELIEKESLTSFSGVPANYEILLQRTDLKKFNLESLRYVTQAGGAMRPDSIASICDILPSVKFYVMYGQTEATSRISWLPPEDITRKKGSVGIPLKGVNIRINEYDENGIGEICIKGKNVMQGYWEDHDSTAKVLIDGWLHTGDLGYLDEDEFLFITGRISEMIKSGANRISPFEIEEVVYDLPEVEQAAVTTIADDILGEAILLVISLKQGVLITEKDVLRHCQKELPGYMLPKQVLIVEDMPMTSTGKIQRYKLNNLITKVP